MGCVNEAGVRCEADPSACLAAACGCESFTRLMDAWGPEGCRQRRQEILDRLGVPKRPSGPILGRLPLRRTVAAWLLDLAIRRAETNTRPLVLPATKYVTTAELVSDALALVGRLPADLDGVVAIGRSGLLPATVIACHLHVPMWLTSEQAGQMHVVLAGAGIRMSDHPAAVPQHLLLVDDTTWSGHAMRTWFPVVGRRISPRPRQPGGRVRPP